VRSGDRNGQFCILPCPVLRSGNCLFRLSVTLEAHLLSCFEFLIFLNFNVHGSITVRNRTYFHMTFLTGSGLRNMTLKCWQNRRTLCVVFLCVKLYSKTLVENVSVNVRIKKKYCVIYVDSTDLCNSFRQFQSVKIILFTLNKLCPLLPHP
jgi:hypothetical protein